MKLERLRVFFVCFFFKQTDLNLMGFRRVKLEGPVPLQHSATGCGWRGDVAIGAAAALVEAGAAHIIN